MKPREDKKPRPLDGVQGKPLNADEADGELRSIIALTTYRRRLLLAVYSLEPRLNFTFSSFSFLLFPIQLSYCRDTDDHAHES